MRRTPPRHSPTVSLRLSTTRCGIAAMWRDRTSLSRCNTHRAARYWTHRFSADVTGIDLNPTRVRGAEEPTALVGLESHRRFGLACLSGEPIRSS
jgi:hypothetical protein